MLFRTVWYRSTRSPSRSQLVHGVLAGNVHDGELAQGRLLIGGVVVDVHVRVVLPALLHIVQEVQEGLLLRLPVVGPERPKTPADTGPRRGLDDAEQVLEPPDARWPVLPQRIALEVEEDVAGARRWSSARVFSGMTA